MEEPHRAKKHPLTVPGTKVLEIASSAIPTAPSVPKPMPFLVAPPLHRGAPNSLFSSSLCVGDVWFYCQHGVSNERQMVSNVTWKKMYKQQQNYMFFFPVVFAGRICDLFAVNTAYNDMVHRSTAKCVQHSLHTCIKCNAIGVWRQRRWAQPWG